AIALAEAGQEQRVGRARRAERDRLRHRLENGAVGAQETKGASGAVRDMAGKQPLRLAVENAPVRGLARSAVPAERTPGGGIAREEAPVAVEDEHGKRQFLVERGRKAVARSSLA